MLPKNKLPNIFVILWNIFSIYHIRMNKDNSRNNEWMDTITM
jgi:hypothetical protein